MGTRVQPPVQKIFLLIFGLVFISAGLCLLVVGGQVVTLQCQHLETLRVSCVKQSSWMGIIPMGEESIENLRGAEVNASPPGGDDTQTLYRIELITERGNVPLMIAYRAGDRARESAEVARINAFVQKGKGTLEVRRGGECYALVGGALVLVLGLGVAAARPGRWRKSTDI